MSASIIVVVAALIAGCGTARAQVEALVDSTPVVSGRPSEAVEFTPMTRSERFRSYLTGAFGPGSLAKTGVRAGIDELIDSPEEWGQDARGYGQRLGNAEAKHIIRHTLEFGAASLLHEDDRYLASGQTGFWGRTKYAIASTFLARRGNGDRTFAFARIGSAAGTAFISRAWQPPSASGLGSAASSFGLTLVTEVGTNVVREFWPDLKRHFQRN
jgi:hypothetical protein